MIRVCQYRICALLLTGVFCLFNIGLPVIVATCPMMVDSVMKASCCYDTSASSGSALRSEMNSSCCRTIIAAERNTNEFLQGTNSHADFQYVSTAALPFSQTSLASESLQLYFINHSPPSSYFEDIPVFISSLLI